MAANDYYNDRPSQPQQPYSAYDATSSSHRAPPSYPPSYTSQTPHLDRPAAGPTSAPSPFETVFDDHVYPTDSHHTGDAMHSQHSFAQDTRYHSSGPGNVSPIGDDIPLREHQEGARKMGASGFTAMDSTDHVYDTPENGLGPQERAAAAKGRLRFGELGFSGGSGSGEQKRRIPIFVYLFSLIQIGVFIAELVKAGEYSTFCLQAGVHV